MIFLEFNNCHPDPCMNGTCMDQENSYTCSCFDGYKGTNCDGKICICIYVIVSAVLFYISFSIFSEINPVCFNITCQNGGSCVYINETKNAACVCFNNFVGEFCEGIMIRTFD